MRDRKSTLESAWDAVLRSMASDSDQHEAFADSLEEEVDRPLTDILERKKFKDIQRKISTCIQLSTSLEKRIRKYENTKHVLRRDFNVPPRKEEEVEDEAAKKKTPKSTSIFSPFEDFLTQSSSSSPVDAAVKCLNAWNELEEYRERHDNYIRSTAGEAYDMSNVHYEYCRDALRKYVVYMLNMSANSQFDVRKLIDSVDAIDVSKDMRKDANETELDCSLRTLSAPCGEIHFLATSETEDETQKRRNSTDIRHMFKSSMRDAVKIMANTSSSISEFASTRLSPKNSRNKKNVDGIDAD